MSTSSPSKIISTNVKRTSRQRQKANEVDASKEDNVEEDRLINTAYSEFIDHAKYEDYDEEQDIVEPITEEEKVKEEEADEYPEEEAPEHHRMGEQQEPLMAAEWRLTENNHFHIPKKGQRQASNEAATLSSHHHVSLQNRKSHDQPDHSAPSSTFSKQERPSYMKRKSGRRKKVRARKVDEKSMDIDQEMHQLDLDKIGSSAGGSADDIRAEHCDQQPRSKEKSRQRRRDAPDIERRIYKKKRRRRRFVNYMIELSVDKLVEREWDCERRCVKFERARTKTGETFKDYEYYSSEVETDDDIDWNRERFLKARREKQNEEWMIDKCFLQRLARLRVIRPDITLLQEYAPPQDSDTDYYTSDDSVLGFRPPEMWGETALISSDDDDVVWEKELLKLNTNTLRAQLGSAAYSRLVERHATVQIVQIDDDVVDMETEQRLKAVKQIQRKERIRAEREEEDERTRLGKGDEVEQEWKDEELIKEEQCGMELEWDSDGELVGATEKSSILDDNLDESFDEDEKREGIVFEAKGSMEEINEDLLVGMEEEAEDSDEAEVPDSKHGVRSKDEDEGEHQEDVSDEEMLEEDEYEVEEIVDHEWPGKNLLGSNPSEYDENLWVWVKWVGYPSSDNSRINYLDQKDTINVLFEEYLDKLKAFAQRKKARTSTTAKKFIR